MTDYSEAFTVESDPYPIGVYGPEVRRRPSIYGPGYVYVMRRDNDRAVKIGISADPWTRRHGVSVDVFGNKRKRSDLPKIELLVAARTLSMRRVEMNLHRSFEEFRIDKNCEWFTLPDALLKPLLKEFRSRT